TASLSELEKLKLDLRALTSVTASAEATSSAALPAAITSDLAKKLDDILAAPPAAPSDKTIAADKAAMPSAATTQPKPAQPASPRPVASAPVAAKPAVNFEEYVGGNLISKIGIAVLVIGLAFYVRYAIENNLINPLTRVVIGFAAGLTLLGFAIRLKEKYLAYSAVLLSGGMATIYFTTFAAYDFYKLIPRELAFGLMLVLMAFTVFAALQYDQEWIGIFGFVGAYAVPLLLGNNSGDVTVFFSYITILNTGILILSFRKYWRWLTGAAFVATWLIFGSWISFGFGEVAENILRDRAVALGFGTAFFLMFYLSFVAYKLVKLESLHIVDAVLILLNTAAYYGAGYYVFSGIQSGLYLGLFTLGNALVHFLFSTYIYRAKLGDRKLFYFVLGLVLTFLVIAVPVQLDGNWVTLLWSVGALLLFSIGRTRNVPFYESIAFAILVLATFSLLDDWSTMYGGNGTYRYYADRPNWTLFLNTVFMTSVIYLVSLGAILMLAYDKRYLRDSRPAKELTEVVLYIIGAAFFITAYFTFYFELSNYFYYQFLPSADASEPYSSFNTALAGYRDVWIQNYNLLFLALTSFVVAARSKAAVPTYIALALGTLGVLVFFAEGLPELGRLREIYIETATAGVNRPSPYLIFTRYVSLTLLALLLFSNHWLMRRSPQLTAPVRTGFVLWLNFVIVIVLSNELTNVMMLSNITAAEQAAQLSYRLGYSILWGVYALLLIAIGLWKRIKLVRLAAIALFAFTLLKLALFDIADLETGSKIIVFIALGVLLLVISFLYQRFKSFLLSDDELASAANAAASEALLAGQSPAASSPSDPDAASTGRQ
ncbi:MAG: DUF2339 domain-containing protein, partial [Rhizobacter sp.]|nr:DUF2339 domain-containing protein [Chlorobiales bacterium]